MVMAGVLISDVYSALPPQPAAVPAQWWGQTWGTVEVGKKTLRPGETVTITATIYNGGVGEPRWECAWCNWNPSGTSSVKVASGLTLLQLVDYEPKAVAGQLNVSINNYGDVTWTAVDPPTPPQHIDPNTYCYCDAMGATGGSGQPNVPLYRFRREQTFTVTMRVKPDATPYLGWGQATATLGGNIGALSWSNAAKDYYTVGGEIGLTFLPPIPDQLVANGISDSLLGTRVFLRDGEVPLANQRVHFRTSLGHFGGKKETSVLSHADGLAQVVLSSGKQPGVADIHAWIESDSPVPEDRASVTLLKSQTTLGLEATPGELPADGKAASQLRATLLFDQDPAAGETIWFHTDRGCLFAFDPANPKAIEGDRLTRDLSAVTNDQGVATLLFIADDEEATANLRAEFIPDSLGGDPAEATTQIKMVDYKIEFFTNRIEYLSIPGRSVTDPLVKELAGEIRPSPTLHGRSRIPVTIQLTGPNPLEGIVLRLSSDTRRQLAGGLPDDAKEEIQFPETIATDAEGKAEFNLSVMELYEYGLSPRWPKKDPLHTGMSENVQAIELTARLERSPEISETVTFPVDDNFARLINAYEYQVPRGLIWEPQYWIRVTPIARGLALTKVYAGSVTNAWSYFDEAFSPYTCGGYQTQVLYLFDTLRTSDSRCFILNGFDFGPIKQDDGAHQAAQLWPSNRQHTDGAKSLVFDPWPSQDPKGAYWSLMDWEAIIGLSLPVVGTVLQITTAPGSSNETLDALYPNTGNPYPATPYWPQGWDVKIPASIRIFVDCPVYVTVTDSQGNKTGYRPLGANTPTSLIAEIPDLLQYPMALDDGTRGWIFEIPPGRVTLEFNPYENGTFTLYKMYPYGNMEVYTAIPITPGNRGTITLDSATPGGELLVFDGGQTFLPDTLSDPMWTLTPTPTATPVPTNTPIPTATPVSSPRDVRVVLGWQAPASLETRLQTILNSLSLTHEFLRENGPEDGEGIEFWRLANSSLILYSNGGMTGRRMTTLQSLQTARNAGIPLVLMDNDLAWSQQEADAAMRAVLKDLTRFEWGGDGGGHSGYTIHPADPAHPAFNGLGAMRVGADLDRARIPAADTISIARDQENQTVVHAYTSDRGTTVVVSLVDYQYPPYPPDRFTENILLWLLRRPALASPYNIELLPEITCPSEGVPGEKVHIQYRVTQTAASLLEATWRDGVHLFVDTDPGLVIPVGGMESFHTLAMGDFYDGEISIQIPNLPDGDYFLMIVADEGNSVPETDKTNNNRTVGPFRIRRPNLVAGNLRGVPLELWPGQKLNLQWTVTNEGSGRADAPWTDCLVFVDDLVPTRVLQLACVPRATPLNSGAAYEGTALVEIPNVGPGNWKIVLVTDRGEAVPESNEADNAVSSPVVPIRHPNLMIADLVTSPTGSEGQPLHIVYQVWNTGPVPASCRWREAIYLSSEDRRGDDRYLGSLSCTGELEPGGNKIRRATVQLPGGIQGLFRVLVILNPDADPPEVNADDNMAISNSFVVGSPDLAIASLAPAPGGAVLGEAVHFSWRVTNPSGFPVWSDWLDCVFLAPAEQPQAEIKLGCLPNPRPLMAGTSYDAASTFTIPPLPEGQYWLILRTDANQSISEYNENNNEVKLGSFTLTGPDLVCSELALSGVLQPDRDITFTWRVANEGHVTATAPWSDCLYLSTDPVLGSDFYLGSIGRNHHVAPHTDYTASLAMRLPDFPEGDYWLLAATDRNNIVQETNESNNLCILGPVSLRKPNLTIEAFSVPAPLDVRGRYTARWRVRNTGERPAYGVWSDGLLFSADDQSGGDTRLAGLSGPTVLAPGEYYDRATSFTVPTVAEGGYWIILQVDENRVVLETTQNDNVTSRGPIAVFRPNLVVQELDALSVPADIYVTQEINLGWNTANIGQGFAPGNWSEEICLSPDPIIGGDLGWSLIAMEGNIPPGGFRTRAASYVIPPLTPEGDYYLLVTADQRNDVLESNETDNYDSLGPYRLHRSNLTLVDVTTPTLGMVGKPLPVRYRVANTGEYPINTQKWNYTNAFYMATNPDFINPVRVGSTTQPPVEHMLPGASFDLVTTITLPVLPAGLYYFRAATDDAKALGETNEADNQKVVGPFRVGGPDLVTSSALALTSNYQTGQPLALQWIVRNDGDQSADGAWEDAFFLSRYADFNAGNAHKIGGVIHFESLAPGDFYQTAAAPIIPSLPERDYWVFIVTDSLSTLPETNENNNVRFVGKIHVSGPDLAPKNLVVNPEAWADRLLDATLTVQNDGTAATAGSWNDCVALIGSGSGAVVFSECLPNPKPLAPQENYTSRLLVPIPPSVPGGSYYVALHVDPENALKEVNDNNNFGWLGPLFLPARQSPDLWIVW